VLVNVDPFNPVNSPRPAGMPTVFGGVRLVSRRGIEDYVQELQANSLYVLAVVNEESGGYLVPGADLYQIGNEPDIDGTRDSMSAHDYAGYAQLYRETYPDLPMILAGLASGNPLYLREVQANGGLKGFSGVAFHYPKDGALIERFSKYAGGLPKYVTEFWTGAQHIIPYLADLHRSGVVLTAWFSWGYDQWALKPDHLRALRAA